MSYLAKIDSPNKAYILGFIYGSGSIYNETVTICGKKDILLDIAEEINFGGIVYSIGKSNRIHIHRKGWANDLADLGLEQKNAGYYFPAIHHVLLNHFLRGLFDARANFNYRRYPEVQITLWHDFAQDLRDILGQRNIEMKHYFRYSHVNTTTLFITKQKTFESFMGFIYLDKKLYEESNFLRYQDYLKKGV